MLRRSALALTATLLVGCSSNAAGSVDVSASAIVSSATSTPIPSIGASHTPASTPTIATAEPTATPEAGKADLKITASGFSLFKGKYDSAKQIGYGVVVENPNASWIADNVDVSIDFLDANGGVIDTVTETFAAILPGDRVAWADTQSDYSGDWSKVDKMEVTLAEPDWEAADGTYGTYTFSKIQMRRDTLGDLTVTARLKSTFDKELENPEMIALFYRGPHIVGGAWTFLEHARDGAAVKVSTSYSGKADKVELYGVLTNLSLLN